MRPIRTCHQSKTSSTVPDQGSRASPESTRGPPSLFFKAAWLENSRDKEPHIIAKTTSRAKQYPDHKFKPYILEHNSTVVRSEEVGHTSTGIIRLLLGLSAERSRTLLWMVCHKLVRIEKFYTLPEEEKALAFWKAFWELIRCHYLLWRTGIAHGDISIENLMYNDVTKKAIVNDFDLTAVMTPGDISPQKRGFERTGTKPFMALEPLENAGGQVKWRYRHDLESFAWCLLWFVMAEKFPKFAVHGLPTAVYAYKCGLARGIRAKTAKPGFGLIWKCVVQWVRAWVLQAFVVGEDEDGRKFVEQFIALSHEHGPKIPLDDSQLDWVEFQVPPQASSPSTDANVGI